MDTGQGAEKVVFQSKLCDHVVLIFRRMCMALFIVMHFIVLSVLNESREKKCTATLHIKCSHIMYFPGKI